MAHAEEDVLDPEQQMLEEGAEQPFDEEFDDSLSGEIRRQLKAAPWYVTSLVIHMVALMLLFLIPTIPEEPERESIVLTTEVIEEPPEEEEEEEPEPEEVVEDPLEEVMTETDIVAPPTEVVTETEIDTQVQVDAEVEEVVVDEVVGDPSEEEVADASEDAAPNLMGVGSTAFSNKAGLSSGFRGGFGKIGRGIRGMVRGGGGGGGKGLCLVWLLDQSGSMKDDQEAVAAQARDIQDLLTDGGQKKMYSAVVTYGAGWRVTQPLTKESSEITDAILNVQIDPSGQENTCHAISYVCNEIMAQKRGWTKVLVLLTDESSSDQRGNFVGDRADENSFSVGGRGSLPMLEVALKSLVSTKTRLFVIGKESPFQSDYALEPYVDETGHRWPFMRADRGPESAIIEVPIENSTISNTLQRGSFRGEIKAGFGVYDLAYLAQGSKGAYFILDEAAGNRRPMSRSQRMRNPFVIDWEIMDLYKPDIVSRFRVKDALFARGKQGQRIWELRQFFKKYRSKIKRHRRCRVDPAAVEACRQDMRTRMSMITQLIDIIGDSRATDEQLYAAEYKRQIANLDLYYCVLLADEIITDSWLRAFEEYKGPYPAHPGKGYGHHLALEVKGGAELTEEDQILFEDRMRRFTTSLNEVIRRHPNTPWAQCANWMQGGPAKYGTPRILRYKKYKVGGGGGGKSRPRPRM